jgi:uncharacterized membrane protein YdjX (TVP38/TMEM64 family)
MIAASHDLRSAALRLVVLVAAGAVMFTSVVLLGWPVSVAELQQFVQRRAEPADQLTVVLLFIPVFVALTTLLFFPVSVAKVTGGLLLGVLVGIPVVLVAVVLSAVLPMLAARHLVGQRLLRLLPTTDPRITQMIEQRGLLAVVAVRMVPHPFVALSYASGLTRLPVRTMALGTLIGTTPSLVAYVVLGDSIFALATPRAAGAAAALVVVTVVGMLLWRRLVAGWREDDATHT